jgi:hypothetical protein
MPGLGSGRKSGGAPARYEAGAFGYALNQDIFMRRQDENCTSREKPQGSIRNLLVASEGDEEYEGAMTATTRENQCSERLRVSSRLTRERGGFP